ncbi:MAG: heparinase II/III family protein, partial [bacterium]|nr:heparinase II/III family protein [bacterium]
DSSQYKGWLTDNTLDLGHATLPFAVGFDLVYDLLSAEDVREIADYYEPYFHRIAGLRYECVRQMPANTPIIGHCGVGLMALSLADAYPEERRGILAEAVRSARAYAMAGLDGAIKEDGACVEGSGYSSASMHYLAVFSEGLRRVCGVNLFEHPTWKRNPRYLCLEMLPGGRAINNYNDNHYDGVTTGFWMFVSRNTGDQTGAWVWDHFSGPSGSGSFHRGDVTVELPYLLLNRDPDTPVPEPEAMGISPVHHFDKIHHLVMRTGWAADDLHVTFQCTPYDPDVHAHAQADRLNVTMYGLGERLLVDSGYGLVPIEGSTQVKRMGKLGESHNQVQIDGVAQEATPVQEGNCKIDRWEQVGDWVWAVSDATAFYKGARSVRRAVVTRLDKEAPLVLLADLVVPEPGEHGFEWLLQTEEGNRYEVGEDGITLIGHRTGARVRIGQCANLPVEWGQDVWISHPRLIGSSTGSYLVALTAIGKVDSLKADGLTLSWKDSRGTGKATVELGAMEDGVPSSLRLTVEPGGLAFEV